MSTDPDDVGRRMSLHDESFSTVLHHVETCFSRLQVTRQLLHSNIQQSSFHQQSNYITHSPSHSLTQSLISSVLHSSQSLACSNLHNDKSSLVSSVAMTHKPVSSSSSSCRSQRRAVADGAVPMSHITMTRANDEQWQTEQFQ